MLTPGELVVGVYSAPSAGGLIVASAVVRPAWIDAGGGRRGDMRCIVLAVRRESGPDFVRRLGEELDYVGLPLGAARSVHGVIDVSDAIGGEYLVRALTRDRRLRRMTSIGKLVIPGAIALAENGRDRRDAYRVSRAALFMPFAELSASRRVEIGRDSGDAGLLRELAAQLKAATAKRPEGDDEQREDLARALVAAVWYADAHDATRAGGAVTMARA